MQTQRVRTPFSTFKNQIGHTMIVPDNKNLELNWMKLYQIIVV